MSSVGARRPDTVLSVDPVRNPYAPGAGQRPPELAGRGRELDAFDVVLERVARGRPERSLVLTGLRGVGKTVLLNALRSQAIGRLWGTGKIEARPDQSIRRPVAAALHMALREVAGRHRDPDRVDAVLGVLKAFALREPEEPGKRTRTAARTGPRWQPGIDVPAAMGRADTGDLEIDLVELFGDVASVATDLSVGVALFIDEMQDIPAPDVSALCAACHELSQTGAPLIAAAEREDVSFTPEALDALYAVSGGYPYFVQAYGKVTWDAAPADPITKDDVLVAAPAADAELAVGFFGSRYERATPAERDYMRAMAALGDGPVGTPEVDDSLGRKPSSLS